MADCDTTPAAEPQQPKGRVIENVGMLDWRSIRDKAELADVAMLRNIGTVLVLEQMAGAVASIPTENVGMVIPVPEGDNISVQLGQLKLSGDSFAQGPAEGILVLVGQVLITSPVTSIGYKELRLTGQMLAPKGSEAVLGAKLGQVAGQVIYYPYPESGADVRSVTGNERINAAHLELLDKPLVLLAVGNLVFDDDVTPALLREKIASLVVVGNVAATRDLAPAVQALCAERVGNLHVYPKGARFYESKESLGPEDLEYLPDALPIVIDGKFVIGEGVTADMVKAKIKEIVLAGKLVAPRALLPLLRSLISQKDGELVALEDEEAD